MTNSQLQIVGDFLNLRCMYQEPVYIATVQNAGSKDYFWASKSVRCLNIFKNYSIKILAKCWQLSQSEFEAPGTGLHSHCADCRFLYYFRALKSLKCFNIFIKLFNWNFVKVLEAFSIRTSGTRNRFSRSSCRLSDGLRQL